MTLLWLPAKGSRMSKDEERQSMALLERLTEKDGPPPQTCAIQHIYVAYDEEGYFISRSVNLKDLAAPKDSPMIWWIYYQDTRREVVFHNFRQVVLDKHTHSEVNMPYACFQQDERGSWYCTASAIPLGRRRTAL